MTTAPEPKDKLDAMTGQLDADADAARIVSGPKGDVLDVDWDAIDWRAQEDNVRRLRQRIFTATRDGDWATVQDLPKLMLRSLSNTLVSVRQVTQRNTGRGTAGIDGMVALTSQARAEMAVLVHATWVHPGPWAVMRFTSGICFAGIYVVAESWLNHRATSGNRGRLLATYMLVGYGGEEGRA